MTNTSLANTLKSYVTSSSLSTTLGSYVTKTSLTTTLGDYVTKTSLNTTLGGYAKLSSENTFNANNNFNGTTLVKNLSFNGGILNGDSTLGVVCDTSRFNYRSQAGESYFHMWGSSAVGKLCIKNMQNGAKNTTGILFYTHKDPTNWDDYAMLEYNTDRYALSTNRGFDTNNIYKINGENMCNYRKLRAIAKLDPGAQGSASVTAYGLYVNNILVKIIGYYTAAVALDTGATGITFNIGWDRQQSSDFQSIRLSYLSEKEKLRRVTTDTWHCEVWIDAAYYGGNNVSFMLV